MKKRVYLWLLLALSMSLSAQTIRNEFYGCELGNSSKTNTMISLSQLGIDIATNQGNEVTFADSTMVDGVSFAACTMLFESDQLSAVIYSVPQSKSVMSKAKKVMKKYRSLVVETNTTMLWKCSDGEYTLSIYTNEGKLFFAYRTITQ